MEVKAILGIYICARTTTATIRQEADEEHKVHDTTLQAQIHPRLARRNEILIQVLQLYGSATCAASTHEERTNRFITIRNFLGFLVEKLLNAGQLPIIFPLCLEKILDEMA